MANKYQDIRFRWLEERGFNVLADEHQLSYVRSLWAPLNEVQAVFCNSRSGTGKTSLATLAGVYGVEKAAFSKIIYVRNAVPVREQGFLPGDLAEKEEPYMAPLVTILEKIQPGLYEKWYKEGRILATTTSHLRGITFDDAFVILDEVQNWDLEELQTVYTRCTDSCKIVSIGCTRQIDNKDLVRIKGLTPFEVYMLHYKNKPVAFHTLVNNYRGWFANTADDIQETINKLKNEDNTEEFMAGLQPA